MVQRVEQWAVRKRSSFLPIETLLRFNATMLNTKEIISVRPFVHSCLNPISDNG